MVETPRSLNDNRKNYFARESFILKICGISLAEKNSIGYKVYSFIVRYCFTVAYPFVAFGDLNKHGFEVFAQAFPIFLHTSLVSVTIISLHKQRVKLGKLLARLEEQPFLPNQERGGDKEIKFINEWALAKRIQGLILYIGCCAVLAFAIFYTVVKRIKSTDSSELINSFAYGPLTILDITRSLNYEISWLYQNITMFFIAASISTIAILLFGTLAFICFQFQMLQNNLRTMTKYDHRESITVNCCNADSTKTRNASEIPWTYLKTAINGVVSYHTNILEIISEVHNIFGIFIFALYLIILCSQCFTIYAISILPANDPHLALFCIAIGVTFSLPLIISYWGEQVAYESVQVGKAAYEANFVGSDLKFQKALNLIVLRSQRAARIKAGHFLEVSMVTFGGIVRSSFSFFTIVKNLNIEKNIE